MLLQAVIKGLQKRKIELVKLNKDVRQNILTFKVFWTSCFLFLSRVVLNW